MSNVQVGTSGFPSPQVDITPAGNPFVQQLLRENAELRRLAIARDGIQVLAGRIREEGR